MITRRGLFGFACGGAVAAAAAPLVGECPSNGRMVAVEGIGPTVDSVGLPAHAIEISGASGDAHIRAMVEQGIEVAMRRHNDAMRRGGFGAEQARYTAMKG